MIQWVAAGAAAVGAVSSIIGGNKAKKQAKEAGKANAALIQAETAEQIRRTQMQFDQQLGLTRAMIGASGVTMTGTPVRYLEFMSNEQRKQLEWTKKAGDMRAKAARKQGSYVGGQAYSAGVQQGIGYIGQAASYASSAMSPRG